jgi:hypothetical protein
VSTTEPTADPRHQAVERIKARRAFWRQTATFIAIEAVLIAIWAIGDERHFWPVWPALFFVLATAGNAWRIFGERPISDEQIQRELERQRG